MAKGIGIVLVVSGHLIKEGGFEFKGSIFLLDYIYSFHMALFFIISGIILARFFDSSSINKTSLLDKCIKLSKRLIIPYFLWSIIYFILQGGSIDNKDSLYEWVLCIVSFRGRAPIWFLAALFWAEIIALFILYFTKAKKSYLIIFISLSVIVSVVLWHIYKVICISTIISIQYFTISFCRNFVCLAFVLLGVLFSKFLLKDYNAFKLLVAFLFLMILSVLVFYLFICKSNIHTFDFENIYIFYLISICGSFGVLLLCKLLNCFFKIRLLQFIGIDSMGIMCFHYVQFPFMKYASVLTKGLPNIVSFVISLFFVLCCSIFFTEILKRKLLV